MERTTIDTNGPVSFLDHGGSGKLIVCVHGLEGSAYNWNLIAPELAETHRVVAPDLSGFGYTPPGERGSTVEANTEVVAAVIREYGDEALLIGNSMGGLISMITAVEHANHVDRLVLINPALPVSRRRPPDLEVLTKLIGPLVPGIGVPAFRVYRAAHSPEEETTETLRMITADAETVPDWAKERLTETNRLRRDRAWAIPAFLEADRSIARYVLRPRRFARLIHRIGAPTLLVHGSEDRLVSVDSARWAAQQRPDWTYVEMEGVGHVPMLEAADEFAAVTTDWLASTS